MKKYFWIVVGPSGRTLEDACETVEEAMEMCIKRANVPGNLYAAVATYEPGTGKMNVIWTPTEGFNLK